MKGRYLAKAIGTTWGQSEKGNIQIAVICEITQECPDKGQTISWLGTFSELATDMAVRALRAFGWKGDDLSDLFELDAQQCKRFLGREVELVIDEEEYKGKVQTKVKFVNEPGASRFSFKASVGQADLRRFAASMKSSIRAIGSPGMIPSKKRDDDIPF